MKYLFVLFAGFMFFTLSLDAQTSKEKATDVAPDMLPYEAIPDYPTSMTTGNAIGRVIDALGYRYYWATEGLRQEDLTFDPGGENQSAIAVLNHIHGLAGTLINSHNKVANERPAPPKPEEFTALRKETLMRIKSASDLIKSYSDEDIEKLTIAFKRGEQVSEFPYWHILNGPLADAIYHVGQIVSYRRSSGNPIHPGVSVFMGKTRE